MGRDNGKALSFGGYGTPFADQAMEIQVDQYADQLGFNSFSPMFESPFSDNYQAEDSITVNQPQAEAFVELLAELNHEDFKESLIAIAGEIEESIISRFDHEDNNGNATNVILQRANEYVTPLLHEIDTLVDRASEFSATADFRNRTDNEIDQFINELEFDAQLTPAQEQLFGSIVNKVKGALKAGKKLIDKVNPIKIALNRLQGLVNPMIKKVLNSLIGKLPVTLQPFAKDLAKKFLKLEVPVEDGALGSSREMFAGEDYEQLAYEFDLRFANLVFSNDEIERTQLLHEYAADSEAGAQSTAIDSYSLDDAREQFINKLKRGEDVQLAMEQFLPALYPAVKVAISLVGRKRVINFLAGLLTKLVEKYVPKNVARPLASSIVDLGLGALGFEVADQSDETLAYEAIANTVEETIRTIGTDGEAILSKLDELSDGEAIDQLAEHVLPAFNKSVANNFPGTYIKKSLQRTREPGVWVLMPRKRSKKAYKKFSKVYPAQLTSSVAESIKTFGDVSLKDFMRDTLGQDLSAPVHVRVHVYEAVPGTTINKISLYDRAPGLGSADKSAAMQIHPLSVSAATSLLSEPGLGKDVASEFVTSQEKITIGQRFFYIEMPGAMVRRPKVRRRRHVNGLRNEILTTARTSDIQAVFNFIKSEVTINFYLSETNCNDLVDRLNKKDWIGTAELLRSALRSKLTKALMKNMKSKVKIIHEAVPELYLRHIPENEEFFGSFKKIALGKVIEKVAEKMLSNAFDSVKNFFKSRSKEFADALAQPEDGITIRIGWSNIAGMSQIRSIINLLRGEGSISGLKGISLPSLSSPVVKILAGKNFL